MQSMFCGRTCAVVVDDLCNQFARHMETDESDFKMGRCGKLRGAMSYAVREKLENKVKQLDDDEWQPLVKDICRTLNNSRHW